MTQVGYGIGDISTAEKRQLASGTDLAPPSWPDSPWGRVAAAAWHGRCDVFTDFLRPVLRACAESVTYLAEPNVAESASRLSDIAFRTCLADLEAPGRSGRPRAGGAVVRAGPGPGGGHPAPGPGKRRDRAGRGGPAAVPIRGPRRTPAPSWSGSCSRPAPCTGACIGEARRTVSLWQELAAGLDGPASRGSR